MRGGYPDYVSYRTGSTRCMGPAANAPPIADAEPIGAERARPARGALRRGELARPGRLDRRLVWDFGRQAVRSSRRTPTPPVAATSPGSPSPTTPARAACSSRRSWSTCRPPPTVHTRRSERVHRPRRREPAEPGDALVGRVRAHQRVRSGHSRGVAARRTRISTRSARPCRASSRGGSTTTGWWRTTRPAAPRARTASSWRAARPRIGRLPQRADGHVRAGRLLASRRALGERRAERALRDRGRLHRALRARPAWRARAAPEHRGELRRRERRDGGARARRSRRTRRSRAGSAGAPGRRSCATTPPRAEPAGCPRSQRPETSPTGSAARASTRGCRSGRCATASGTTSPSRRAGRPPRSTSTARCGTHRPTGAGSQPRSARGT